WFDTSTIEKVVVSWGTVVGMSGSTSNTTTTQALANWWDGISDITVWGINYRVHKFTTVGTGTFQALANITAEVLVVAWGWGGWYTSNPGWWWWAWWLLYNSWYIITSGQVINITVGSWWLGELSPLLSAWSSWYNSIFGTLIALGGWRGGWASAFNWWSGWGWNFINNSPWGTGTIWQWNNWWKGNWYSSNTYTPWWGGWAGAKWDDGNLSLAKSGNWGIGLEYSITWTPIFYAGWGWGAKYSTWTEWYGGNWGWWNWGSKTVKGSDWIVNTGWWWWGGSWLGCWDWGSWIVIVRYRLN
ncbi:MAG: hypothetical protein ACD_49C00015G0001, partial [uncultured bacterium (gcode 4)]